jgi:hypothetical protein
MAIDQRVRQQDLLRQLLSERGGPFATFFVTDEGIEMPGGLEEVSGYALDRSGTVYSFWVGWDDRRGRPAFTEWEEVRPEPHWEQSSEYQKARRSLR